MAHVQRINHRQPDVSVDATSLVPPPLELAGIHPHQDDILLVLAAARHIADVIVKAGIAAGMGAHQVAVHPHRALAHDTVEL